MKRAFLVLVCCVGLLAPAAAQVAKPRIDPAGIAGHVLLGAADAVVERFIALAGSGGAVVVLVPEDAGRKSIPKRVEELAETKSADVYVFTPRAWNAWRGKENRAAALWLAGDAKAWRELLPLAALKNHVGRGGVIALTGELAGLAGADGFDLVPDAHIPQLDAAAAKNGHVGYQLEATAGLWINQRNIRVLGDGSVTIHLAKSKSLEPRRIELTKRSPEDLTALRRAALARSQPAFPPAQAAAPVVPGGTLFIVGGGGMPPDLFARFVEAAGGKEKANIVVFPTAQEPIVNRDALLNTLRKAGANKATALKARTLAEVDSPQSLEVLREATGLWFDGGRQWRFVDAYEGTRALDLMWDVLKKGRAIGGTSAGATIQGDYLCRGSPFGNFEIRYEGYERGLGFLPGVAIDQHFSQRKRAPDMAALMKTYPQLLGIGIDEATALVVKGHVGEIQGRGKVFFFDARRDNGAEKVEPHSLPEGGRYDLKSRRVLEP